MRANSSHRVCGACHGIPTILEKSCSGWGCTCRPARCCSARSFFACSAPLWTSCSSRGSRACQSWSERAFAGGATTPLTTSTCGPQPSWYPISGSLPFKHMQDTGSLWFMVFLIPAVVRYSGGCKHQKSHQAPFNYGISDVRSGSVPKDTKNLYRGNTVLRVFDASGMRQK